MGKNSAQAEKPSSINPWVMQAPVVSTGHLTRMTYDEVATPGCLQSSGLNSLPMDGGVLVSFAGETLINRLPADLRACVRWAFARGYQWLRFDSDGDTIAELPQYSWDEAGLLADRTDDLLLASLEHDLYKDGDPGIPDSIRDANGDVVLGFCKRCGRGEAELIEPCVVREDRVINNGAGPWADLIEAANKAQAMMAIPDRIEPRHRQELCEAIARCEDVADPRLACTTVSKAVAP